MDAKAVSIFKKGSADLDTSQSRFYAKIIARLKAVSIKYTTRKNFNSALAVISACAEVLYGANQVYTDSQLEELVVQISDELLGAPAKDSPWNKKSILFYDGFGLNSRGLVQIYLKALCKLGHVIYVTDNSKKDQLPDVLRILKEASCETVFLQAPQFAPRAKELYDIFLRFKPGASFLYTTPSDVAAICTFASVSGLTTRYNINLTDHAFWLGTCAFDYCLEFRDYGASISVAYRNIPEGKLIKLPFYPAINFDAPFKGFPFPHQDNNRVVFSGGFLYKTLGGDGKYYKLVSNILENYPDVIFWYAGSGDRSQMDELIAAYPGRVFLTAERSDLYQVLQNCFIYLSTYPLCGGLMFQYAASAGKIPVTLKYDNVSDDFLLDQSSLNIEFSSMEEVVSEIDKLFTDDTYRLEQESRIRRAVLNERSFYSALEGILCCEDSGYPIHLREIDTAAFRREYLMRLSVKDFARIFAAKKYRPLIKHFPVLFGFGALFKIKSRLFK